MTLIESSQELIQWAEEQLEGTEIDFDGKKEIVASSLDVALEHHKAIILLISQNYFGSAFSLVRVLFETYILSLWLNYCADEQDLDNYKKHMLNKKFFELINEVEQIEGYQGGTLTQAKEAGWQAMNSFTHSGYAQIERRLGHSGIEPNYETSEIAEVIHFTNATGLLCCLEISFLAENEELSLELLERIKQIES